jgi:hypothetical protein
MRSVNMICEKKLREAFVKYLTVDSETQDARKREFNKAIFDAEEGWACFNGTDLSMVMEKFDKAVRECTKNARS